MKFSKTFLVSALSLVSFTFAHGYIEEIPGPGDMGGMVMPTVGISGTTLTLNWNPGAWNPATQSVLLESVGAVTDGDSFDPNDPGVSNYAALLNPESLGGNGNLFSTRYGFMMSMGGSLGAGNFFAIRIASITDGLIGWNNPTTNVLNPVFDSIGDTVLWSGGMWHTLFTLSPDAAPGLYSIQFEISVMSGATPTWDGYISSDLSGYTLNSDFNILPVTYTFEVVPEPSVGALGLFAAGLWALCRHRNARSHAQ